jgi:serine/threonine-protein kinase
MNIDALRIALADRYRLERELGAGGMATVYLAQDLKHDRRVAIKVLRPELAAVIGAERFLAEIKTTANLQHPHILPLFDSGKIQFASDPHDSGLTTHVYYVMPFVEGESLRDRLDRERQLPIADAVRIASEVASALDYAHRHGVIHRDIKPENILLHDGQALVADFGIALAASRADGSTRMTETGMSLGTPHYMSPEQAMGERDLDARTDVYALGCVLSEMLTGEPPFSGPSAQAIVAKVMTERPTPPSATRDTVPEAVEDAVLTALSKLPVDRFASAAEFAAALSDGRITMRTTARRPAAAASGKWRTISIGLGAAAVALAGLAAWAVLRPAQGDGPAVYDVGLPDSARMSFVGSLSRIGPYGALVRNLSLDPDGQFVVYAATRGDSTSLWYRSLLSGEVRELPGTEGATGPRLSPDGSQVGYFDGDRMMAAPIAGGDPRLLMMANSGTVIDWISPDQFFTVDEDGYRLNRFQPSTGSMSSTPIARCVFGVWVAETGELLCSFNGTAQTIDHESGVVTTVRLASEDGSPGVPVSGSAFRLIEGRYLVWLATDGNLVAASYDAERHLAGRPTRVLGGVRREALGEGQYDIAENGTLVYAPGLDASIGRLVRFRPGQAIEPLLTDSADYQRYDLSADGRWLAAVTPGSDGNELRIYDLPNGQQFTWLRAETIRHAMWSPAGDRLLIGARTDTMWAMLRGAPGSGQPVDTLATFAPGAGTFDPVGYPFDSVAIALDWSSGVLARFDPRTGVASFDTVLTGARFPSVAPSGRLIAYQTVDESRVVVTTFPVVGRRWQVAVLGVEPLWLSDNELVYRFGAIWYSVRVNPATGEPLGAATLWGRDPRFSDTSGWSNRPDHAGGVIYVKSPEQPDPSYLRVIPNWVEQMKRAVDTANK